MRPAGAIAFYSDCQLRPSTLCCMSAGRSAIFCLVTVYAFIIRFQAAYLVLRQSTVLALMLPHSTLLAQASLLLVTLLLPVRLLGSCECCRQRLPLQKRSCCIALQAQSPAQQQNSRSEQARPS